MEAVVTAMREGLTFPLIYANPKVWVVFDDEWPQSFLGHIGDEVVEQAALAEQRMDAAFYRAGSERSVHAEAFTGRAEQRYL